MRNIGQHRFTELRIKSLIRENSDKRKAYHDGGGLYLVVGGGASNWVFRYMRDGKAHSMGLGPYPDCTLGDARRKAEQNRNLIHGKSVDPLEQRREQREAARAKEDQDKTFRYCAEQYVETHKAGWRNAKHAEQWSNTLAMYALPIIGDVPVSKIDTPLVLRVLEPIWNEIPETASRLRGRMENILDWAKSRGYRTGENPARWKGNIKHLLPARAKVARVEHHPALPYRDMPAFMAELRKQGGTAPLALEFTILTAARTSEVIGMTWREVDLDERMWTVPADRMKAGKEHRVPLCDRAIAILRMFELLDRDPGTYIFPGIRRGKPLSNMAMLAVLPRMGRNDITVHGFRSTFRVWCAETGKDRDEAELALAHTVSDKTEAAYNRSDMFDRRRRLANEWCAHITVHNGGD